ncbi:MAG: DUF503 family protein [Candidatus Omnitrophica bacterium]|nr:DUF503 family protein [Candidatus Omnitrophota bacterium]
MRNDVTAHIGLLTVEIHIPHEQSLKEKRMVLKRKYLSSEDFSDQF